MSLEGRLRRLEERHDPDGIDAESIEWLQSLSVPDLYCVAACLPELDVPLRLPADLSMAKAQERGRALIAEAPYFVRQILALVDDGPARETGAPR